MGTGGPRVHHGDLSGTPKYKGEHRYANSEVLTHRFKVDDYQDAFKILKSGNCGKVILEW